MILSEDEELDVVLDVPQGEVFDVSECDQILLVASRANCIRFGTLLFVCGKRASKFIYLLALTLAYPGCSESVTEFVSRNGSSFISVCS